MKFRRATYAFNPTNTKHLYIIDTTAAQRLRRWSNIVQMLCKCFFLCVCWETIAIHCLHDFAHKQDSQLNSLVLITVWRVVIEVRQDSQLNSSAFSHCSVSRVAIGKGVLPYLFGHLPYQRAAWPCLSTHY